MHNLVYVMMAIYVAVTIVLSYNLNNIRKFCFHVGETSKLKVDKRVFNKNALIDLLALIPCFRYKSDLNKFLISEL